MNNTLLRNRLEYSDRILLLKAIFSVDFKLYQLYTQSENHSK